MIHILGLGPGNEDAITMGTINILTKYKKIYLRTSIHPTVKLLKDLNIEFQTFDNEYEKYDNFDLVYNSIAMQIIEMGKNSDVVYGVPGHPLVSEKTVQLIIEQCLEQNLEYKLYPAVSFIDSIFEVVNVDPGDGLQVVDAFNISEYEFSYNSNVVVTQVYNRYIASELKLAIMNYYGSEKEVIFLRAIGVSSEEFIKKIPVYELDRQLDIDHLTTIFIPKEEEVIDIRKIIKDSKKHLTEKVIFKEKIESILNTKAEKEEMIGKMLLELIKECLDEEEYGNFNLRDVLIEANKILNTKSIE